MVADRANSPTPGRVTPAEVKRRLTAEDRDFILLDIRTPEEWQYDGRIHGARWIPMDDLLTRSRADLPREAEIVLYCAHGVRSAAAARYLARAGYRRVRDMVGGIIAWEAAGFPVIGKV